MLSRLEINLWKQKVEEGRPAPARGWNAGLLGLRRVSVCVMPASIADSFHQISTSGSVGHGARCGVSGGFLLMWELGGTGWGVGGVSGGFLLI